MESGVLTSRYAQRDDFAVVCEAYHVDDGTPMLGATMATVPGGRS